MNRDQNEQQLLHEAAERQGQREAREDEKARRHSGKRGRESDLNALAAKRPRGEGEIAAHEVVVTPIPISTPMPMPIPTPTPTPVAHARTYTHTIHAHPTSLAQDHVAHMNNPLFKRRAEKGISGKQQAEEIAKVALLTCLFTPPPS